MPHRGVSPCAICTKFSVFVGSSSVGYVFKFGEFAQGVPELWEFKVGLHFPPKFSVPASSEMYIGCERVLKCKNDTDLLHHCAKYDGTGTLHTAIAKKFHNFFCFFVCHAFEQWSSC